MNDRTMAAITGVREAFANQVAYCRANGAPITGRVVEAIAAALDDDNAFARRIREWQGHALADAVPLRAAGGMHALQLSGVSRALDPLYRGEDKAMARAEHLVADAIELNVAALLPWLDGPPQTNEVGRSSNYIAAMLWLADRGLPARFDCLEVGSSAGINLMIDRYRYRLDQIAVGPSSAEMVLAPEWHGSPPPARPPEWNFVRLKGCDVAPVDLRDPLQLRRLMAYVWPEHHLRFERLKIAAEAAKAKAPDLVRQDADAFIEAELAHEQAVGTTRIVMHSIVWQYLGTERQVRIRRSIEAAGAAATDDRPLAWIALEANRESYKHELIVRYWPGDGEPHLLARAHAHGASVDWLV